MPVFSYKALASPESSPGNPAGGSDARHVVGTLTADSPRDARDQLRRRGLLVRDVRPLRKRGWRLRATSSHAPDARAASEADPHGDAPASHWTRRRHEDALVGVYRELATLLQAGIPLLQSLDAIIAQQRGRFRDDLMLLRERIAAGESLADAMRSRRDLFDDLAVSMIEVGERAGTLGHVLDQLAAFKQRSCQLRNRVGTALIYPAIVLSFGVAVALFLMSFVVPQLLEALSDTGKPLPLPTRIVRAASDVLLQRWWLLLLLVAIAAVGLTAAYRFDRTRRLWHRAQLHIPIFGSLIRKQAIVRIAVTMSALTRSGVEFVSALRIARRAIDNLTIRDALCRAQDAVAAGRDIAPALDATGVFPPTVVQIVDVGQSAGQLDVMLDRLAADYDQQVQTTTQRLIALMEPALILLLAGFIGLIVLAVILPYLEAGNVL